MTTQSYIGKGSVYLAKAGNPLVKIGNTSKLEFAIEEEKKELQDFENPGGVADSVSRIKSVKLSLSVHKLSAENLALALRGDSAVVAGGATITPSSTTSCGTMGRRPRGGSTPTRLAPANY